MLFYILYTEHKYTFSNFNSNVTEFFFSFFFNVLLLVHKTPRVACSLFVVTCFSENEMDIVVVVVVRTGSVFLGLFKEYISCRTWLFSEFIVPSVLCLCSLHSFSLQKKKNTNYSAISAALLYLCTMFCGYAIFFLLFFFLEINQTYLKLPVPFVLIYFST